MHRCGRRRAWQSGKSSRAETEGAAEREASGRQAGGKREASGVRNCCRSARDEVSVNNQRGVEQPWEAEGYGSRTEARRLCSRD